MTKRPRILTIAASLILSAGTVTGAPPADGWQAFRWGMTAAEIEKTGMAVLVPRRAVPGGKYYIIAEGRAPMTIVDAQFSQVFEMDNATDRLAEIALVDTSRLDPIGPRIDRFEELARLLAEKYGPPKSQSTNDDRLSKYSAFYGASRSWSYSHTTVQLEEAWLAGRGEALTIRYRDEASSDASKL